MKKTLFIIAACALAAVSCQKETAVENGIGSEGILTVTADIAQFGADTKTSIDGTATTIKPVWSANDSIKLFNTDNQAFVYIVKSTDAGKASAEFEPKSTEFSGTFACAYYPADTTKYVHGTGIIAGIPATQVYAAPITAGANAGSFANGSFPMVGTGTLNADKGNLDLTFKNVFGLVQLNFTGTETITKIDLVSTKSLSGTATIATDGSCATTITKGNKQVSLTFETPVTLTGTATAFYIAVPADTTVSKVYVTTSTSLQYKEKAITAKRSHIASLNSNTLTGAGFKPVTYSEASTLTPQIINGTVWAPVNCGYDATNYKYGKLYQWGRAVGGGYNKKDDPNNDAGGIIQETEKTATVSTTTPNTNPADNVFYKGVNSDYDWYIHTSDNSKQLQSWPMKSGDAGYVEGKIAIPCPAGWRVPTYDELNALLGGSKKAFTEKNLQTDTRTDSPTYNMSGLFFDGTTTPKPTNGVFLPAEGNRSSSNGNSYSRGSYGYYLSSTVNGNQARYLYFYSGGAGKYISGRACGYSVRCVQE